MEKSKQQGAISMESKGIIFNIQKFSIHDGPGVRTTVFLKGCPLRCEWCANPESQLSKVQILYDDRKCVHCRTCVNVCPQEAVTMSDDGRIHIDFQTCDGCLECVKACPGRALSNEGEYKTAQEVFEVCMQDYDFYEESGGGVTISGGEGMCQPDFVEELLGLLKTKHIHTAIETTGVVSAQVFQRLAPQFDLLLFDVKHCDPERHQAGTAVRNDRILENLAWAKEQGLNILPRIPVIPGFNASLEDARGIAALLVKLGLSKVQLLPFHQMGERKYEFLNRDYTLTGVKALHPEDLTDYQQCFLDAGLDCYF
jgi:pyruvate formate lyase activating enzyme